ncbi:unnamed protein product [Notodromas monacha]|uniref:RING-type domain-containing protein n=1 Tax=Notodromas monacha TaxID=399045 RepID=A0A7R9BT80_9CRUS|nr:unnamed protein product [Notodromas monacha]CAG0919926.1 unnamed protein product [Notodromas monacha]
MMGDLDLLEMKRVMSTEATSAEEETQLKRSRSRSVIRHQHQHFPAADDSNVIISSTLDAILDAVTCSICMELVHNAVSPCQCLHAFCGGCLSSWIFRQGTPRVNCPKCRTNMRSVSVNHLACSVSAELEKVRPEDAKAPKDKILLDQANRFSGKKMFHLAEMFNAEYGSRTARGGRRRRVRNPASTSPTP